MTTAIAQFMRELERAWDAHREALLVRRDLAAALAPLAAEPTVLHIPAMTGQAGAVGSRQPGRPAGPALGGYWPSSQRPGAMSLAALAGPHDPGA